MQCAKLQTSEKDKTVKYTTKQQHKAVVYLMIEAAMKGLGNLKILYQSYATVHRWLDAITKCSKTLLL